MSSFFDAFIVQAFIYIVFICFRQICVMLTLPQGLHHLFSIIVFHSSYFVKVLFLEYLEVFCFLVP